MKSVKKKFGFQLIASNAEIAGHLVLSVILARLLEPEDIGIYSMSAVLVAIAHLFRDFGVSSYIKQQKELTEDTIRSALGVVMFTSWLVALSLYLSAPLWSAFFNEPRVEDVVQVLAMGFLVIPFGAIPGAILVRNLEVVRTAKVGFISLTVYFTASILLAQQGFGHMTMAWANLINIITHVTAIRWLSSTPTPLVPRWRGWGKVAHFGVGSLLTSSLTALHNAIPDIFLGKMSTPTAVGLFSKATSTVNIASSVLMPAVNYFSLPYLSKLHHQNNDLPREICKITSYLATILLPAMGVVALLADEIIVFLYGEKWRPSAVAVPWLCLAAGLNTLFTFSSPALTGIGKPYIAGIPLATMLLINIALIMSIFDGSLQSFAIALATGQLMAMPVFLWVNHQFLKIGLREWLGTVFPVVLVTAIVVVCTGFLKSMLPVLPPFLTIVALAPSALVVWLLMMHLLRLPLYRELRDVLDKLRKR